MSTGLIIYIAISVLVILINHLIIRFLIKTEKQAIIFMIVKFVIVAGVAIYTFNVLNPYTIEFKLLYGFLLAMLIHNPPKDKKKSEKNQPAE